MSGSVCVHEFPVRLKEVAWDHVYFGTMFTWFEIGRTELCRSVGFPYTELTQRGIGSFVTRAVATYRRPVPPTGRVRVETRLAQMSKVRFAFHYRIFALAGSADGNDSELCVTGFTEHACANLSGRVCRLPKDFTEVFIPSGEAIERTTVDGPDIIHWSHDVRVRYEETDAFGVVYNGNYFAWMESAWSGRLMGGEWDIVRSMHRGTAFTVVNAECRYLSPAYYDSLVHIEVGVTPVSATRVQLSYRMTRDDNNEIIALGQTRHAFTVGGRPSRVPSDFLDALTG
jgi:acyl-CoA thioester hydrolase